MHASIWKFTEEPDELAARCDAMVAEIPQANLVLHMCLRADDGIVLVDTCPSAEVFAAFVESEGLRALRAPRPSRAGSSRRFPGAPGVRRRPVL